MFPLQMVRFKFVLHQMAHFIHVSLANGTALKTLPLKWPTLSMFPSQVVHLKIVSSSNGKLYICFPRKWYSLNLFSYQNIRLYPFFPCKWYALKHFPAKWRTIIEVSLANGMP